MKNSKHDRAAAIIIGAVLLFIGIGTIGNHTNTKQITTDPSPAPTAQSQTPATTQPAPPATPTATTPPPAAASTPATTPNTGTADTNLSNNNTYTNVDGATVHSPAASTDGSIPAGATAQCSDGTYSFSQHRSGTCSHHGGVATWL